MPPTPAPLPAQTAASPSDPAGEAGAAFTPGPWMRDGISVTTCAPAGQARTVIATAHPHVFLRPTASMERMRANARLMAAAPELYEALLNARDTLRAYQIDYADSRYLGAVDDAEAALAKAEGR